jgi:hypothetical protein
LLNILKMAKIKLSPLLTSISGSVAGSTFQRSLGGHILRSKPLKRNVLSEKIQISKAYMSQVIAAWHNLTSAQQTAWYQYANFSPFGQKKEKSRALSGYNLFVKYNCIRLAAGLSILNATNFLALDLPAFNLSFQYDPSDRFIAGGNGINSLAYSLDGINWTGLGSAIFSTACYDICFNGSMFVAVGEGINTIAYSSDGINWTGIGSSIFTTSGRGVCWNGSMFVAVGEGVNTIAYSSDGINWSGEGNTIFPIVAYDVCWNGSIFVAVGNGGFAIAYSSDGITWSYGSYNIFTTNGLGVCWNGSMFVAVGQGGNSIAYSYDGDSWTGLGTSIFGTAGCGICWNGSMFVATGELTNTLAYSSDGINWTGLGTTIFSGNGYGVCWNGSMFVAVGTGVNTIAYSSNGINWTGLGTSIFSTDGIAVTSCPAPKLYPPVTATLYIDFSYDLITNGYFVLVKLSRPVPYSIAFRSNMVRVVLLTYAAGESFPIDTPYYNVFYDHLVSGDSVYCEVTIFALTSGKIFAPAQYLLEVP